MYIFGKSSRRKKTHYLTKNINILVCDNFCTRFIYNFCYNMFHCFQMNNFLNFALFQLWLLLVKSAHFMTSLFDILRKLLCTGIHKSRPIIYLNQFMKESSHKNLRLSWIVIILTKYTFHYYKNIEIHIDVVLVQFFRWIY